MTFETGTFKVVTLEQMAVNIWTARSPMTMGIASQWDAFVSEHEGGTVFHSSLWLNILQSYAKHDYFHIAIQNEKGICGILSLYSVRGLSGKKNLYSLPYTAYGGLLADSPATAQLLHDEALKIAKSEKAGMVNLRNTIPSGLDLPSSDLSVQFIKTLPETEEACLEAIPRKSRATIRKGMANFGLTFIVNQDWEMLWELHAINLKKLGTPVFPKKFFKIIMEGMGNSKADILFVLHQGKPVCGVMNFYFKDICNPYFSGSLPEANATGANNYMYYALMCHALKRDCKTFDFGKSRRGSGSFDFKKNMGFEPRTLPFQYIFNTHHELPNFNPSNPKLARFIDLWSRQPLWTSKIVGPILNRFLP